MTLVFLLNFIQKIGIDYSLKLINENGPKNQGRPRLDFGEMQTATVMV
jgi:hypothetical protein